METQKESHDLAHVRNFVELMRSDRAIAVSFLNELANAMPELQERHNWAVTVISGLNPEGKKLVQVVGNVSKMVSHLAAGPLVMPARP